MGLLDSLDSETLHLDDVPAAASSPERFKGRAARLLGAAAALALVAIGLPYAYWVCIEHRLTVVAAGRVYQSAEMSPAELARLTERLGIRTVFDFRDYPDHDPRIVAERSALEGRGVRYVHVPASPRPSLQAIAAFVGAMRMEVAGRRAVLLHCHDGEGRAVFFSAVYRMEFEGWNNERAYNGTARLPPYLMFVNKIFPFIGRLSSRNPKTPLILDYRPLASAQSPSAAGGT